MCKHFVSTSKVNLADGSFIVFCKYILKINENIFTLWDDVFWWGSFIYWLKSGNIDVSAFDYMGNHLNTHPMNNGLKVCQQSMGLAWTSASLSRSQPLSYLFFCQRFRRKGMPGKEGICVGGGVEKNEHKCIFCPLSESKRNLWLLES